MRLLGFVALVLSLLGPVAAQTPAGPFIERPYLQLGNLPHAAAGESLALLWHAADEKGEWVVEVKTRKDEKREATLRKKMRSCALPAVKLGGK